MNNIKLSFGDKENYRWIKNGNNIVCIIDCSINLDYDCYYMYIDTLKRLFPKANFNYSILGISFESKGVAKCDPRDEYNEVLGERIAESKAKQKAYDIAYRIVSYIADTLDRDLNILDKFVEDMGYQNEHEKGHINFLITGE